MYGYLLSLDGSFRACLENAIGGAWRAFWSNLGYRKSKALPIKLKLRQLERNVAPILLFRASRWPFCLTHAKRVDRVQRRMIKIIMALRKRESESVPQFCLRAATSAARTSRECGLWSVRWSRSVVSWSLHVARNHNLAVWAAPLLDIRSSAELSQRRRDNGGRPGTRRDPGFIIKRWVDSVPDALNYLRDRNQFPHDLFERGVVLQDGSPCTADALIARH